MRITAGAGLGSCVGLDGRLANPRDSTSRRVRTIRSPSAEPPLIPRGVARAPGCERAGSDAISPNASDGTEQRCDVNGHAVSEVIDRQALYVVQDPCFPNVYLDRRHERGRSADVAPGLGKVCLAVQQSASLQLQSGSMPVYSRQAMTIDGRARLAKTPARPSPGPEADNAGGMRHPVHAGEWLTALRRISLDRQAPKGMTGVGHAQAG